MRRKHGVKAFVLAMMAAALGLMAFSAVGAQAQLPGASAKGIFLVENVVLSAKVTGAQEGTGRLLVAGRKIDIKCTAGAVENAQIIATGTEALATAKFSGCKTFEHNTEKEIKNCIIKEGTSEAGGSVTAKAIALPILHEGTKYVLFEPDDPQAEGLPFATVSYHQNLGCVLPLNNPVSGSVSAEVVEGNPTKLVFSEPIQLLTGDTLNFGTFPSYITATATVEGVDSTHTGDKLGLHKAP